MSVKQDENQESAISASRARKRINSKKQTDNNQADNSADYASIVSGHLAKTYKKGLQT